MKTLSIRQYLARPTKLAETEFAKEESGEKHNDQIPHWKSCAPAKTNYAAQCHWRVEGMTPRRAMKIRMD